MKKVSIIIPTYNSAKYIIETVESALGQKNVIPEVIVVDDGSTDGTKVCLQNANFLNKIKYFYQNNKGVSVARNLGLSCATGEFYCFLDSDDLLEKNFCGKLIEQIEKQGTDIAYSDYVYFYDGRPGHVISKKYDKPCGFVFSQIVSQGNLFPTDTVLFKRNIVPVAGFDAELKTMEDWWFWIQLTYNRRVAYVNEKLCKIRVRENSLSSNDMQMLKDAVQVFKKILIQYESDIQRFSIKEKQQFYYFFANAMLLTGNSKEAVEIVYKNHFLYNNYLRVVKLFVKWVYQKFR